MTWVPLVVAVVMTNSIVADPHLDNPCAVLGRNDFVHIGGRCFYISPSRLRDERTFENARLACTLINGSLAILSTEKIRQDLFFNREEHEFRWVGMQPITNYRDLTAANWVDDTSAQDVFDAAEGRNVANPLVGPLCLTLNDRGGCVVDCGYQRGYICESELPVPLTPPVVPLTTLKASTPEVLSTSVMSVYEETTTLEEVTARGTIPQWIILMVSAIAASLVFVATVPLCVCLRRRYKRKSAIDVTKAMPPSGGELESSAGDSLQPHNQIQLTDNDPVLLEAPSTDMYAVPHVSKRGNQYSDVRIDNEDVSKNGVSAPKPVFKVQETERKGDVYAEVNLAEKRKYKDAEDNASECDYSTTLVENTIYGE